MTTIAANREMMACDSQATRGYLKTSVNKIWRVNGDLIGVCGNYEIGLMFVEWYRQKGAPPSLWDGADDNFSALVLTSKGRMVEYGAKLIPMPILEKSHAVGSGAEMAIGAMEAGADPAQAVRIAVKRSDGTGGKIRSMRLK